MHWLDYRKRLGIDFDDEEKGAFCTALILNKLNDLSESRKERLDFNVIMDFDAVSENEYKLFCSTTGKNACLDLFTFSIRNSKTDSWVFVLVTHGNAPFVLDGCRMMILNHSQATVDYSQLVVKM